MIPLPNLTLASTATSRSGDINTQSPFGAVTVNYGGAKPSPVVVLAVLAALYYFYKRGR